MQLFARTLKTMNDREHSREQFAQIIRASAKGPESFSLVDSAGKEDLGYIIRYDAYRKHRAKSEIAVT